MLKKLYERIEWLRVHHNYPLLYLMLWVLYAVTVIDFATALVGVLTFPQLYDAAMAYHMTSIRLILLVGIILIYSEVKK